MSFDREQIQNVALLGSTGSIGQNTLEVIDFHREKFRVVLLQAHQNTTLFLKQCQRFRPRYALLTDADAFARLDRQELPPGVELLLGYDRANDIVCRGEVDTVVSAIVGAAGLSTTLEAVRAGKKVCLANKETLVVAGSVVMEAAKKSGATILPIDSEHSAIHQALRGQDLTQVARMVLTASGGPFRGKTRQEMQRASPREALKHPTWEMGRKITIDSATLINKALELIETHWLFGIAAEALDVVVHPESFVHSFVEFVDGSVLAQLSPPDMRLPIQYALLYPDRLPSPARKVNWLTLKSWHFEQVDRENFPGLNLGYDVIRRGGSAGAALNAANEVAVQRFLEGDLEFLDIPQCCFDILQHHNFEASPSLEQLFEVDRVARREAFSWKNKTITV